MQQTLNTCQFISSFMGVYIFSFQTTAQLFMQGILDGFIETLINIFLSDFNLQI